MIWTKVCGLLFGPSCILYESKLRLTSLMIGSDRKPHIIARRHAKLPNTAILLLYYT